MSPDRHGQRCSTVHGQRAVLRADVERELATLPRQVAQRDARDLRRQGWIDRDAVLAQAQPAKPVEELLQEAADRGDEGELAADAGLGELIERPAHERIDAALQEVV